MLSPVELRAKTWLVRQDLNLQQHGCKPCALPLSYGPKMAGLAGLEPATLCFEGTCSLRLSYRPTWSARWDLHPHPLACHASAPLLSYEPLLVLLAGFEPALYSFSNCCLCRWATGAYGASGGICTPSANGSGFTDRPGSLAPKLTHTFAYIRIHCCSVQVTQAVGATIQDSNLGRTDLQSVVLPLH